MKIRYVNKEEMPNLERRDFVGIFERLLRDPNNAAEISVSGREEAALVQTGIRSSSGVRAKMPNGYIMKTRKTENSVWVWLELKKRKTGTNS